MLIILNIETMGLDDRFCTNKKTQYLLPNVYFEFVLQAISPSADGLWFL